MRNSYINGGFCALIAHSFADVGAGGPPPNTANRDDLRERLLDDVTTLGNDAAEGKDALPKLAVRVVRAANDGIISADKAKKGGKDDATLIYEQYVNAESKAALHEMTDAGRKANVSKMRKLIEFGAYVNADAVDVLDRAVRLRHEMAEAELPVQSAYPAYVSVARAQLDADRDLDDDAIKSAMGKKPPKDKEVLDQLKKAQKILDDLILGKNGLTDQSDEVVNAQAAIEARIKAMLIEKDTAETIAKATALGLIPATPFEQAMN